VTELQQGHSELKQQHATLEQAHTSLEQAHTETRADTSALQSFREQALAWRADDERRATELAAWSETIRFVWFMSTSKAKPKFGLTCV
jgi:hypothetical protein